MSSCFPHHIKSIKNCTKIRSTNLVQEHDKLELELVELGLLEQERDTLEEKNEQECHTNVFRTIQSK